MSLVDLDLGSGDVPEFLNLEYLKNVHTIAIDLMKNVKLPLILGEVELNWRE